MNPPFPKQEDAKPREAVLPMQVIAAAFAILLLAAAVARCEPTPATPVPCDLTPQGCPAPVR